MFGARLHLAFQNLLTMFGCVSHLCCFQNARPAYAHDFSFSMLSTMTPGCWKSSRKFPELSEGEGEEGSGWRIRGSSRRVGIRKIGKEWWLSLGINQIQTFTYYSPVSEFCLITHVTYSTSTMYWIKWLLTVCLRFFSHFQTRLFHWNSSLRMSAGCNIFALPIFNVLSSAALNTHWRYFSR